MIRVLINKFTFMKDSKQSFKDLVKKMDSLEETPAPRGRAIHYIFTG